MSADDRELRADRRPRPSTRARSSRSSIDRFRFADGDEVEREIVRHQGAAGDRRPRRRRTSGSCASRARRSATPTSSRSRPGGWTRRASRRSQAAQRELAEEIGKARDAVGARHELRLERGHLRRGRPPLPRDRAERRASAASDENERIEIVRWPLDDLDGALAATRDAKTIIALLWLRLAAADRGRRRGGRLGRRRRKAGQPPRAGTRRRAACAHVRCHAAPSAAAPRAGRLRASAAVAVRPRRRRATREDSGDRRRRRRGPRVRSPHRQRRDDRRAAASGAHARPRCVSVAEPPAEPRSGPVRHRPALRRRTTRQRT